MAAPLITSAFLFRFSVPCRMLEKPWNEKSPPLGEEFILPNLAELDENRTFAELRAGWSPQGLAFSLTVKGKRQPPWCRDNRIEDSDGLHIWLDTRDTHTVHRASRFCHHLVFLPSGGGHRLDQPVGEQLLINRARENANPIRPGGLGVKSEKQPDGYSIQAFVPAQTLTGFESNEHPKLGFFYAVVDRELGIQTFNLGSEFPYQEDPSLWGTLELAKG